MGQHGGGQSMISSIALLTKAQTPLVRFAVDLLYNLRHTQSWSCSANRTNGVWSKNW